MKKSNIEKQVYSFQLLGILITVILSISLSLFILIENKIRNMDQNIMDIGELLASSPEISNMITANSSDPSFIMFLDNILLKFSSVDAVTICDKDSIRYYHTNKNLIGEKFIGGDETPILEGAAPYITTSTGTLGKQRRFFHPVYDSSNKLIGFIMVSVLISNIYSSLWELLGIYILTIPFLFLTGILLSTVFKKKIRTLFQGLRPEEFKKMSVERSEVLDTIDEGLIAINTEGEIILINDSAKKIFGCTFDLNDKVKINDVFPETGLFHTIETKKTEHNIALEINGQSILSSRFPVMENGTVTGAVSLFRNKSDATRLAEELTGAHHMLDTLRAFNHEFMNKLHVILGLIEIGEPQKAAELIRSANILSGDVVSNVTQMIKNSGLAALLIGKMIRANELAIKLSLKRDSICNEQTLCFPNEVYVTILGNLIENAIDNLNESDRSVKEINVGIYAQDGSCMLTVDDTGSGIPDSIKDRIFEQGFSTKGANRGFGMYLIKDLIDRYHGTIELETEENVGTSFTVIFDHAR